MTAKVPGEVAQADQGIEALTTRLRPHL
jgi:hypothetical protein